ncbi:MAG: hypothetical protein KatS3mg042_1537 [Rhodothermaceae bacterium]|nr:MAG: hypothetical protein KatS3mg042_1537 [Rhodothermaceae bacterium]
MSSVVRLKTEIQIRLNTVADMSWHARTILAPFRSFATNVRISNVNNPQENVIMEFAEDNYIISLDWNLLAFVSQGEFKKWDNRDGILRFFMDVFSRVKKLDSYSGIENIRVLTWSIISDHCADVLDFRKKYFSKDVPEGDKDAAIIVIGAIEDRTFELHFGPYLGKSDIDRHNLYFLQRMNDPYAQELQNLRGTLVRAEVKQNNITEPFQTIVNLLKEARKLTKGVAK